MALSPAEQYYLFGLDFERTPGGTKKALEYFSRAAEKGCAEAHCKLATAAMGTEAFNDYPTAIKHYEQALSLKKDLLDAKFGLANAAFKLGERYEQSKKLEDEKRAYELYNQAMAHGSILAKIQLSTFYLDGRGGLPKNIPEAIRYLKEILENYEEILKNGHRPLEVLRSICLFLLGRCHEEKPKPSKKEVLNYYEQAASLKNLDASFTLALRYFKGEGVPRSLKVALGYFASYVDSRERSNKEINNLIGCLFFNAPNKAQHSFEFFARACEISDNFSVALHNRAICHERGHGTPLNVPIVLNCYSYLETRGCPLATWKLGFYSAAGIEGEKNLGQALTHFEKTIKLMEHKEDLKIVYYISAMCLLNYADDTPNLDCPGKASEWLKLSAEAGYPPARFEYAVSFEKNGTEREKTLAQLASKEIEEAQGIVASTPGQFRKWIHLLPFFNRDKAKREVWEINLSWTVQDDNPLINLNEQPYATEDYPNPWACFSAFFENFNPSYQREELERLKAALFRVLRETASSTQRLILSGVNLGTPLFPGNTELSVLELRDHCDFESPAEVAALVELLKRNKTLYRLTLGNRAIAGRTDFRPVIFALKDLPELYHLEIVCHDAAEAKALGEVLCLNTPIRNLILELDSASHNKYLPGALEKHSFEQLKINSPEGFEDREYDQADTQIFERVMEAISRQNARNPSLTRLECSDAGYSSLSLVLKYQLRYRSFGFLERLALSDGTIKAVEALLERCPALHSIQYQPTDFKEGINDEELNTLSRVLANPKLRTLTIETYPKAPRYGSHVVVRQCIGKIAKVLEQNRTLMLFTLGEWAQLKEWQESIEPLLARNRKLELRGKLHREAAYVALAFERANCGSPFQRSILPLLPRFSALAREPSDADIPLADNEGVTTEMVSRFLDSRFARAHLGGNPNKRKIC